MTLPPEQYRHLERHVPEPEPEDRPRWSRLTWLLLLVLGVCVVFLLVVTTSRPAQEPTSYLGAGESLALAGTPHRP